MKQGVEHVLLIHEQKEDIAKRNFGKPCYLLIYIALYASGGH
jgi:hypothetical protein